MTQAKSIPSIKVARSRKREAKEIEATLTILNGMIRRLMVYGPHQNVAFTMVDSLREIVASSREGDDAEQEICDLVYTLKDDLDNAIYSS